MSGKGSKSGTETHAKRWAFLRRPPAFLDPIMTRFESPGIFRKITPYVKEGQTTIDIGCGWGFYSFALADIVGSTGKVYSVDVSENCIRSIQKKANVKGYNNIKALASTAADLSEIKSKSVDFVFANGLLCSMEDDRSKAVSEIKRILKSESYAFISLGAPPPFGFVNKDEWEVILEGFNVVGGGKFEELFAVVSLKK